MDNREQRANQRDYIKGVQEEAYRRGYQAGALAAAKLVHETLGDESKEAFDLLFALQNIKLPFAL